MEEKVLKLLDDKMEEFLNIGYDRDDGNARYGVVYEDGKLEDLEYSYCHGRLMDLFDSYEEWDEDEEDYNTVVPSGQTPIAVVNQIQSIKVDEKHALRYYEWLFNFSPYRMVFPEKDFEKVYERHIFVVDTDVPANLMVGGLMASRFPTEDYDDNGLFRLCTLWNHLVDRDVHPNLAYSVASMMRVSNDGRSIQVSSNGGGHQALSPAQFVHTHLNFLNDKPLNLSLHYITIGSYDNINATWGNCRKDRDDDEINTSLVSLIDGVDEIKKDANPFKKAAQREEWGNDYRNKWSNTVDYELCLNPMAEFLNKQTPLLLAA